MAPPAEGWEVVLSLCCLSRCLHMFVHACSHVCKHGRVYSKRASPGVRMCIPVGTSPPSAHVCIPATAHPCPSPYLYTRVPRLSACAPCMHNVLVCIRGYALPKPP